MRWLKWLGISVLILVVLAVTLRVTMPLWIPHLAKRFEPWIRSEIMNVISIYIKPKVTIEKIEYSWPLNVAVSGVSMTAINPTTNLPVTILSVDRAQITLDRIPSIGDPLIFRDFKVDSPTIIVEVLENGHVVGWDDFLKDTSGQPEDRAPSEIFAIDMVEVDQFTFEYALQGYDERMVLDKLDFVIDNKGKAKDQKIELPQGKGWYVVDTKLERQDLFSIKLAGGINIDNLNVAIDELALVMDLSKDSITFFPPQVQDFINKHDVQGHIDVKANGQFNIDDIEDTDANFNLEIAKSHAAFKEILIEVESASASLLYKDQIFSTDDGVISMLSGKLNFTMMLEEADPNDPRLSNSNKEQKKAFKAEAEGILPNIAIEKVAEVADNLELTFSLSPHDMKIEDLHRTDQEELKLAGTVNGIVDLNANLGNFKTTLLGSGEIDITDGKFGSNAIMKAFAGVMKIALLGLAGNDRAQAIFSIEDEYITFSTLTILASPIGVRGSGWINFNENLRLSVNAGPLEGFQESTGAFGRFLGNFTDMILKYIVSGTTEDPHITVAPLGIGS